MSCIIASRTKSLTLLAPRTVQIDKTCLYSSSERRMVSSLFRRFKTDISLLPRRFHEFAIHLNRDGAVKHFHG